MDWKIRRLKMVEEQLRRRGIDDEKVLKAMGKVKRHEFVEEAFKIQAYNDIALPIGYGQTISQPYTVAKMTSALMVEEGMKVLEIGTGSGYQAAVLAEMGAEVYSVERIQPLYFRAFKILNKLRYFNVNLRLGDGTLGWPEEAPFDRILITAGGPKVPQPLLDQLKVGGILIMPVGEKKREQSLIRIVKEKDKIIKENLGPVKFVDLIGVYGWEN